MELNDILIALVIGGVAGFLASNLVKGAALGLLGSIVVGILGSVTFGFLFGNFDLLKSPLLNQIAGSTIGAVILLVVLQLLKSKKT